MSITSRKHKEAAPSRLSFAIITVSTSRYAEKERGVKKIEDPSGDLLETLLKKSNNTVVLRELASDNSEMIKNLVERLVERKDIDVIVTCGGTGVAKSDVTIETIKGIIEKELPGFGEILRELSYKKIGSPAILTRAFAGVKNGKAIFCIPGSPDAVKTATKLLIIPEAPHIVKHARE
jgi:molybdenum cofactor biosynthesis protein B